MSQLPCLATGIQEKEHRLFNLRPLNVTIVILSNITQVFFPRTV